MPKIVPIRLDEETVFYAEVDDLEVFREAPRTERGFSVTELPAQATTSVVNALHTIKPVLDKVVEMFRQAGPNECQVEFGLKLNGKVGVLFSEGGAETHLKVTMKWTKA